MTCPKTISSRTLAIGLGANLPSYFGNPISTLIAIRPEIEKNIYAWLSTSFNKNESDQIVRSIRFRWSPLFETVPIGGPPNQPNYINAVTVVDGKEFSALIPSEETLNELLDKFLLLEEQYGRKRGNEQNQWGPRTIDIDLLSWGDLQVNSGKLVLPHPRLTERSFVLTPLAAAINSTEKAPRKLTAQKGWPE